MESADGFYDFYYPSTDGLRLHARVYGEATGAAPPVVCLPGLTRNARDFHELALFLSRIAHSPRRVVAFDYRGRGQSDYDPNWQHYTVAMEAADILAGLDALGIERAAFIGTSRGGLIIHILASMRPQALTAVVLNDIGPVIEPAGLSQIRDYLSRATRPVSHAEAVAAQRAIHGEAFPALDNADWERMVSAIYREEDGKPVPDFDPALLKSLAPLDLEKPLPDLWPQFEGLSGIPLLAVRGENSRLLSAETVDEMARRHPDCQVIVVEGQGHAPFLETGGLPDQIAAFLNRSDAR